tara:strand:- start:5 stop:379 length:375 start_codon:yes stop_codon:yes gene_type:complete
MFIYKIELNDDFRFVGSTAGTIKRTRFACRVCAKNRATFCTLYKKIRELDIEPTSIDLKILEEVNADDVDTKLIYWRKKENCNLEECRSSLYVDGNIIIKRTNMGCMCSVNEIVKGKPFLMTFD